MYNYRGLAPTTEIGRVYVTDPDDWDLPDKTFKFKVGLSIHLYIYICIVIYRSTNPITYSSNSSVYKIFLYLPTFHTFFYLSNIYLFTSHLFHSVQDAAKFPDFGLDEDTGMITMKQGIKLDEEIKVNTIIFFSCNICIYSCITKKVKTLLSI